MRQLLQQLWTFWEQLQFQWHWRSWIGKDLRVVVGVVKIAHMILLWDISFINFYLNHFHCNKTDHCPLSFLLPPCPLFFGFFPSRIILQPFNLFSQLIDNSWTKYTIVSIFFFSIFYHKPHVIQPLLEFTKNNKLAVKLNGKYKLINSKIADLHPKIRW